MDLDPSHPFYDELIDRVSAPSPATQRAEPVVSESVEIVELRRRHDGWTAQRQRVFLSVLASSGCVGVAAEAADITPRSAYRFRNHPKGVAFAKAWDAALMAAAGRLTSLAFARAIEGTPRAVWREGRVIAETSVPSDRLLMFLLRHLQPNLFGDAYGARARAEKIAELAGALPGAMAAITDADVEADLLDIDDYRPKPPRDEAA